MEIASDIEDEFGVEKAKSVFDSLETRDLIKFDRDNSELVSEYIKRSASQRRPYLRKITNGANEEIAILFQIIAINGLLKAKKMVYLRDCYRHYLSPGRGNRITAQAMFDLFTEIDQSSIEFYSFPSEVFEACGFHVPLGEDELDY